MTIYTITPASASAAVAAAAGRSRLIRDARMAARPQVAPRRTYTITGPSASTGYEALSDQWEAQQATSRCDFCNRFNADLKGGEANVITITISAETPSAAIDELASFATVARAARAQAVAAPARRKASPAPVPIHDSGPVCPQHGTARPSNYGGLYCPAATDAGHCKWTDKAAA